MSLDSVTSVSQLKLRAMRDFSLPLLTDVVGDQDDASGESLESLTTSVAPSRVKLKYLDKDGDYVSGSFFFFFLLFRIVICLCNVLVLHSVF